MFVSRSVGAHARQSKHYYGVRLGLPQLDCLSVNWRFITNLIKAMPRANGVASSLFFYATVGIESFFYALVGKFYAKSVLKSSTPTDSILRCWCKLQYGVGHLGIAGQGDRGMTDVIQAHQR